MHTHTPWLWLLSRHVPLHSGKVDKSVVTCLCNVLRCKTDRRAIFAAEDALLQLLLRRLAGTLPSPSIRSDPAVCPLRLHRVRDEGLGVSYKFTLNCKGCRSPLHCCCSLKNHSLLSTCSVPASSASTVSIAALGNLLVAASMAISHMRPIP